MKVFATRKFEFHAAHHLPEHPTCGRIHGHSYQLEVEVSRDLNPFSSVPNTYQKLMVIDFKELKEVVEEIIIQEVDHCDLNEQYPVPTAELMALSFWITLEAVFTGRSELNVKLERIRLFETSNSFVEVRGDV